MTVEAINDAELSRFWSRMKGGASLTEIAHGRRLSVGELDRLMWNWRSRVVGSTLTDPSKAERLRARRYAALD